MAAWKEKLSKQHDHWQAKVECQKIVRKKEAEKHVKGLLLSHPPICSSQRTFSSSSRQVISASTSNDASGQSKPVTPSERPNVRFMPTHTVHILEEPLVEETESSSDVGSDGVSAGATGVSAAVASQSVEEVIDLSKCDDGDYLSPPDDTEEQGEKGGQHGVDAFAATAESADSGDGMSESASINTLASDVVQSAIEGAVERVSTPTTETGDEDGDKLVPGQGSGVSVASDGMERAGQVEVATPNSQQ